MVVFLPALILGAVICRIVRLIAPREPR